eukprot:CAMPEP_0206572608 /NCGR_PEP_ID=MMETSP0325_2-20121206/28358_1 /ASSEMBLY_ACC=CAM_ASM_000347 /TAXON_ID=2866 /ORGANISM="Crypthecodinium cohnii, Strain Seligo" /LENGTH=380 /DNA_ID=CAMNT_0054076867 /DNA_START=5 /DNA_END=1148 /DNA_ORIENTATION=-
MGAYFSLRGANEWRAAVAAMPEASIWSNVLYSPLTPGRKLLLHRNEEVTFSFPSGLNQDGDIISFSDVSELSMIVGFHKGCGHFYTGLLVHAPLVDEPHTFHRCSEGTVLKMPMSSASGGGGSTNSSSSSSSSLQPRPPPNKYSASAVPTKAAVSLTKSPPSASLGGGGGGGSEAVSDAIFTSFSLGPEEPEVMTTDKVSCPYLLMYTVKEGIMVYLGESQEDCEQVIREVAETFGNAATENHDCGKKAATKRPAEAAAAAAVEAPTTTTTTSAEVECLHIPMGRAPAPVGRTFHELISADLRREYAVRAEAPEQAGFTNCVVFCLRIMQGMKMPVRGYDLQSVCEQKKDLGNLVGEVSLMGGKICGGKCESDFQALQHR